MRKKISFIMLLCLALIVSGCNKAPSSKVFSSNELEITLTDDFDEKNDGYLTLYNKEVKIVIQSTPTESINNLPLEEYVDLLSESISFLTPLETDTANGGVAYEYSLDGEGLEPSRCLLMVYKTDSYYYNVTFSCDAEKYESYRDVFSEWVDSIQIG
ncbi:MAG: hypothetical protein SOW50_08825 [Lachnospiraceae bacterium]|nr:hypothetical protein [Lachnospiraceae bacterium]